MRILRRREPRPTLAPMSAREVLLASQSQTEDLARRIAGMAGPGDAIALSGDLGAGKSVFARAFLRALAEDPTLEVPSPTFSLVQIYDTPRGEVAHFDLWRLDGPEGLHELGWDALHNGIMLVEWPERAGDEMPPDALRLTLGEGPHDDARIARIEGWDERL